MSEKQTIEQHREIVKRLNAKVGNQPSYELLFAYYSEAHYILEDCPEEKEFAFKISGFCKAWCDRLWRTEDDEYRTLYWDCMLFEAQNMNLDSYFLYLEKNREPKDRFYEPRRKCFKNIGLIDGLQDLLDGKLKLLSISLPPGTGKLLADDTPVLTTNGWKNHGDLVVGDYVYGLDGQPKMVQHIFPKDKADCLVTFTNGEQIQCHENHEWVVYDRKRQCERILETKELFKFKIDCGIPGKRGHRYLYQLPKREPFAGERKELPVDPYILGAWLGDGTEKKPTLTINNNDEVISDYVGTIYKESAIYEQVGCKAHHYLGLRQDLGKLGMCGSRKKLGKRIPEEYLTASLEQRLQLLAGLLDTDGTCSKKERKYHYCTTNKELLDGVTKLINTFGWRVCVCEIEPHTNGNIIGRSNSYVIGFSPDFEIPCKVERKQLKEFSPQRRVAICGIERVEPKQGNCIQVEGGVYCVGLKMIPTHNSTIEKFFHSGVCGWFPNDYNLFYSHSGDITRMYFDGIQDILTNSDEYTWGEIFPDCKVTGTNAKLEQININKYKPFPNVQCTSVGAKNAGKVRASKFLLCDDLIGGIEEAMNKNRLDGVWYSYSIDARQRMVDGCRELIIGTRWSVHDHIGRLKEAYDGDERCRFIAVPDIDPVTGKSNFEFDVKPFTAEFYNDIAKLMDEVSYRCLYKNEPVERDGILFPEANLRRYATLPDREPDDIIGQCDTKGKGTDYFVLPVLYKYGDDYYMVDAICNNSSDYEMQYENSANVLVANNVKSCDFERNSGGDRVAMEVARRVEEKGHICNITDTPTETNKEAKIYQCSNWILQHIVFKDKSMYDSRSDYGEFMRLLSTYSVSGKKQLDDVPDVLATFANRITKKSRIATIEPVYNPFWR